MRSLKTSGGLTRGRGMTESTTSDLAALYASVCRDESWHAVSKPRIWRSLDKPWTWRTLGRCFDRALAKRNPFATHTDLINIMTGVHAESSVNVEKAREVRQSILNSMKGKPAAEYSFTKTSQAIIAFSAKSSVKVDGDSDSSGSEVVISASYYC